MDEAHEIDLAGLQTRWNDILDDLESTNRTAWMALFDGRLAAVDSHTVTLDFSDATKLAGGHGFERARRPQFAEALSQSIGRILGSPLRVIVTADD